MHLTMMHMGIIIATLVCVIGIGIYSSRSVRSAAGYSVGGRSAGAPLVAGSIAGTVVGGGATVGTAQLAYHFGLSAWWFTLGSGIAFIIMGLFYAKKMRGTGLETIPQFLAMHYGKKAEELSSVISSIGILFSAVASCLPGIEIVAEVFHVDAYTASALLVLLVAAYTFFGGMKSAGIGGIGGLTLGIGTMITRDMIVPLCRMTDDRKMLTVNKLTVLFVMLLACFIAILNRGSEVLFWTYISMALRGGGIFLPLTLAVFWPGHVKRGWAVLSMLGSTAASLLTATVVKLTIDPLFVGLIVSALLLLPGIRLKK